MKKLLLALSFVTLFTLVACADNRPIDRSQLPATAQTFLTTHFADAKVSLVTKDRDLMETTYDVVFVDGSSVEFNGKGEWKDVECRTGVVPEAIVPNAILDHVRANYPGVTIRKINRDRYDWEVELSNRLELQFDTQFRLMEIDN